MPLDSTPFSLDTVTIEKSGTVKISDELLRQTLEPSFKKATPEVLMGDNGICGSNCKEN